MSDSDQSTVGRDAHLEDYPAPSPAQAPGAPSDPVVVRVGWPTVLTSRTIRAAIAFVLVTVLIAAALVGAMLNESSTALRTLYGVTACVPLAGAIVAVAGAWRFIIRARTARLVVGRLIAIPNSGVRFGREELARIDVWTTGSGAEVTTHMALLPASVKNPPPPHELARLTPAELRPYCVDFPLGSRPTAYELADSLRRNAERVEVHKLGSLR